MAIFFAVALSISAAKRVEVKPRSRIKDRIFFIALVFGTLKCRPKIMILDLIRFKC
jgi:hypothetical protein